MIYENYFKEAVGLLENLISIPATSREEEKRCEFLTSWLEKPSWPVIGPPAATHRPLKDQYGSTQGAHFGRIKRSDTWNVCDHGIKSIVAQVL